MAAFSRAIAFCFLIIPAQAGEISRLDQIIEKGVLRVGMSGDYRPFSLLNPATQEFSGLDVDLAKNLATSLGVKVEFVKTSWPELMKDFDADKFDIGMGGISISLERQKKGFFSAPVLRDGKSPISLCADKEKFDTLEEIDRPGVRVIVNPGGTNEKFVRAQLKQAPVTVFPDNTKIFEEIIAGHTDVMITDTIEARYQQKLHPDILCATRPDQPFNFSEKAYLLPRDQAWKNYVDQWLRQITEDGSLQAATKAWIN